MGYSERVCQLCGVSFNIGRIRRPDEPEHGWKASGWGVNDSAPCEPWWKWEHPGCTSDHVTGEHVAGPGCWASGGYSGFAITYEEMKGCFRVQCLIPKDEYWTAEEDDEEFELDASCFLSGISLHSPAEFLVRSLYPPKHGIDSAMIINASTTLESHLQGWAMPFHPWCFEVFQRISKLELGKVDIDGLWRLRDQQGVYDDFKGFDRGYYVRRCRSQWWDHLPGSEFLAANPLNIPTLPQFMDEYTSQEPVEQLHFHPDVTASSAYDPFCKLPAELRYSILEHLDAVDIANLRLSSRSFRQLPNSLFRRLLQQNMPWFWEMDSMSRSRTNWLGLYTKLKSFESGPSKHGGGEQWRTKMGRGRSEQGPYILGPDLDVKGLRNRGRIWKDVEEIVRRIRGISDERQVENGPLHA